MAFVMVPFSGPDVVVEHMCQMDSRADSRPLTNGDVANLRIPHLTMWTVAHQLCGLVTLFNHLRVAHATRNGRRDTAEHGVQHVLPYALFHDLWKFEVWKPLVLAYIETERLKEDVGVMMHPRHNAKLWNVVEKRVCSFLADLLMAWPVRNLCTARLARYPRTSPA